MRILHVIGTLAARSGGPAFAAVAMASAVARRGHEVAIFTTDHGGQPVDLAPAQQSGVTLRRFAVAPPRAWKRSPSLSAALAEAIPSYDLVHLHSLYLYHDWITAKGCRRAGVPYILRPHGILDPYIYRRRRLAKRVFELWFQNRDLREAAALHYTSEEERQLAAPYDQGAPGVVVPLGLATAAYQDLPERGSFRARHPEIGDRLAVLFLSRLHEKKGLDLLIPAFAQALAGGLDLHLVLAGPDQGMRAKVERWIAERGIQGRVTFTGMITGEDKLSALADCDLYVLPSYSENFGIAVVEAMAAGLPVLISDRVNIWREVEADGAGRIVPPELSPLTEALESLMADPAGRGAMGEAARASAKRRYDWQQVGERLERLYGEVVAGHGVS